MSQDNGPLWDDLTAALSSQQYPAETLKTLDQRLAAHPEDVLSWMKKGHIQVTLQRYEDACKTFEHVHALDPSNAWTWTTYGDVLVELHREDEALDAYRHAIALESGFASAWINMAKALSLLIAMPRRLRRLSTHSLLRLN